MSKASEKEHSPYFDHYKDLYDWGNWSKARLRNAVAKKRIYDWEYEEITGDPYEA